MRVLHGSSELYPLASTGGLASVASALPAAQEKYGKACAAVVIPFYQDVADKCRNIQWHGSMFTFLGEEFGVGSTTVNGLRTILVAKDEFFMRKGIYGAGSGESWPDNPLRFAFFSRALAAVAASPIHSPDIVHCHDWQTALTPVYLREGDIPTVLTIHNLHFQGRFGRESWDAAGLPDTLYTMDALEFWGDWNCLKGGIVYSDAVTTVSPGYAREILTPEFGCGLEGLLSESSGKLTGIINGIDTKLWDPATDRKIPARFSSGNMSGRKVCRQHLEREAGFSPHGGMILGMVSRLTTQKGIDMILDSLGHMRDLGIRLVVLGTGEPWAETALMEAAGENPGSVFVRIAFDDPMARRIFAGSDGFLMPSRFEPCGLGQMMAMRYGSVPLVRAVGGLADTVSSGQGFSFAGEADGFRRALSLMAGTWGNSRKWSWYRRRCMTGDFSWKNSVEEYERVYRKAMESRK
ncbi:MAG TPA: glycogen synthase GlgA [Candidatus Sabulitectum sp.]|nr:glycogen synthase GlgA [Candidatus Sabulitectum sp.]HRW77709.1 glycogen synthase GlgA [Candidatus Sabulitectum sp.]